MANDSHANRHQSLTVVSAETTFTRWDVALSDSRVFSLAPFYVVPPPGRVTFASFGVPPSAVDSSSLGAQFRDADTLGSVKFSCQDGAWTWRKYELLDRLHKKGWSPRVVRHYPSPAVRQLGLDIGTSRAIEMLHRVSIGKLLSQCNSPKQILPSLNMPEFEDVIHRDLSWFNVFCHLEYDQELGGGDKLDRPFIASILGEGDAPCALVADLDHSLVLHELLDCSGGATQKEKTGTPMFRALELTCPDSLDFDSTMITFDDLVDTFERLEKPGRRTYLGQAFPGEMHSLAEGFKAILAKERTRRVAVRREDESPFIPAIVPHAPRHDAESLYWLLVWALGRASPLGATDEPTADFNSFCAAMLKEGWTVPGSGNRKLYMRHQNMTKLLHPKLRYLEYMLQLMSAYFSIPWQLYPEVGKHHAHLAMGRILLATLLDAKPELLRIALNTELPRRCNVFMQETGVRSVTPSTLANMGDATSGTVVNDLPGAVTAVVKRPRTDAIQ